jgi:acyl-CoA thioester hydrolase
MRYKDYKHFVEIQIRFSDIDTLQHVNNACFLNYIELARVKFFNQIFGTSINWIDSGFILARTELDYKKPIYLRDKILCYTKIEKIGNKSLTVKNVIVKIIGEEMIECAECVGVLVAMDYKKQVSMEIPEVWLKLLTSFI